MRARIEEAVRQLESDDGKEKSRAGKKSPKDYIGRTWITRPHPGIDRVSSAWLILRYIDPHAKFTFDKDPRRHPDAIPFDMFQTGGVVPIGNKGTVEKLAESLAYNHCPMKIFCHSRPSDQ